MAHASASWNRADHDPPVVAAPGLVAVPRGGSAPEPKGDTDTNATDLKNKPIDLDVESANLYYALNLLFQHIKANFQLDPSLK